MGVATGLAWTQVGGETLPVEVSLMKGKGQLTLTGQLGDVMKESGQAALSYARARADRLNLAAGFLRKAGHPYPRARRAPPPRTAPRPGSPWPPP